MPDRGIRKSQLQLLSLACVLVLSVMFCMFRIDFALCVRHFATVHTVMYSILIIAPCWFMLLFM